MTDIVLVRRGVAAAALAVCVAFLQPREAAADDEAGPRWGTKDRIFTHIGFNEFVPDTSDFPFKTHDPVSGQYGVYSSNGYFGAFNAIAHVPSGALLTYLELDYCDTNATYDVQLVLYRCSYGGADCEALGALGSDNGSMGCHIRTEDLTVNNFTMDNNAYELVLAALTNGGDASTMLLGAYIGYKLQISAAPSTATFGDVPTNHPYFRAIEALAASGITQGCGGGNFCPNQNVTRAEMAAFLARALGLHFPN